MYNNMHASDEFFSTFLLILFLLEIKLKSKIIFKFIEKFG